MERRTYLKDGEFQPLLTKACLPNKVQNIHHSVSSFAFSKIFQSIKIGDSSTFSGLSGPDLLWGPVSKYFVIIAMRGPVALIGSTRLPFSGISVSPLGAPVKLLFQRDLLISTYSKMCFSFYGTQSFISHGSWFPVTKVIRISYMVFSFPTFLILKIYGFLRKWILCVCLYTVWIFSWSVFHSHSSPLPPF